MVSLILFFVFWVTCGFFGFGAALASFSADFQFTNSDEPRVFAGKANVKNTWRSHLGVAAFAAFGGPLALFVMLFFSNLFKDGFAWTQNGVRVVLEKKGIPIETP